MGQYPARLSASTAGGLYHSLDCARFTARFTTFDLLAGWQRCWSISLTDARELPAVELELLRRAYVLIMG
jgi:hypothetical protein